MEREESQAKMLTWAEPDKDQDRNGRCESRGKLEAPCVTTDTVEDEI